MMKETRIAMLVGLLFIIMFGLVISNLKGSDPYAPAKPRDERAVNQLYAPVLQVEPPPPGDVPGEATTAGEPGRGGLAIADHPTDPCSTLEIRLLRPDVPRPVEAVSDHPAEALASRTGDTIPTIVPLPTPAAAPSRKHVVKAGETLSKIARAEYGPGGERQLSLIRQANKDSLRGGDASLRIGMELAIPSLPGAPAPSAPATAAGTPAPARPDAASTDTLAAMDELRRTLAASGFSSASAPPAPAPGPLASAPVTDRPADPAKHVYVVRPGDNLAKIARTTLKDDSRAAVQKLYNANKKQIKDPDDLQVGMKLEIPA